MSKDENNWFGYLYLKDDGRYLKIGKTVDAARREKEYVTENLSLRKLDNMVVPAHQMSDLESDLLRATEAHKVDNCNGNSTEWRQRKAEVIHAWIEFKEKHSLLNVAQWDEIKNDLLIKAANLHKTQLHSQEEVDSANAKAAAEARKWAEAESRVALEELRVAEAKRQKLEAEVTEYKQQISEVIHTSEEALLTERCKRLHVEAAAKESEELLKKQAQDLWVKREAEIAMERGLANAEIKHLKATAIFNRAENTFSDAINGCKTFAESITKCELDDSPEDTIAAVALAFASVSAVAVTCFVCLLFSL